MKYASDKAKADTCSPLYVPEGGSFGYLTSLEGQPDVGEKVNTAISRLADENDLLGVINNADFDDLAKLGAGAVTQTKASNLMGIFQNMDFSSSTAMTRTSCGRTTLWRTRSSQRVASSSGSTTSWPISPSLSRPGPRASTGPTNDSMA